MRLPSLEISVSAVLVLSCRQTDADYRYTHTTTYCCVDQSLAPVTLCILVCEPVLSSSDTVCTDVWTSP